MELLDDLTQIITIEVSIDLCCRNRFMPKHLLNGSQVRATFN